MVMYFRLVHNEARRRASEACLNAPSGHVVKISPPTRTLDQNAALWASLNDVSAQVVWHGRKLDAESWKNVFTASLSKQDVVPNLDGTGFVVLGQSTSKMTRQQMSDLIDLIHAFGAENLVKWSDQQEAA
jgi:hypothetical protein